MSQHEPSRVRAIAFTTTCYLRPRPSRSGSGRGRSLPTLGWAAEYVEHGVAANCLWPQTYIATDAVKNILGGDAAMDRSRSPEIVADAAVTILERPASKCTGSTFLDVEVRRDAGATDLLDGLLPRGASERRRGSDTSDSAKEGRSLRLCRMAVDPFVALVSGRL